MPQGSKHQSFINQKVKATAHKLVRYCCEGRETEGLEAFYAPDAISVEAMPMPGEESNEMKGVDAIKAKHEWWRSNFEVHDASVSHPFMHGNDRFSVIFEMDVTNRMDGTRTKMTEVGVYHCNPEGQIIREEFFYNPE